MPGASVSRRSFSPAGISSTSASCARTDARPAPQPSRSPVAWVVSQPDSRASTGLVPEFQSSTALPLPALVALRTRPPLVGPQAVDGPIVPRPSRKPITGSPAMASSSTTAAPPSATSQVIGVPGGSASASGSPSPTRARRACTRVLPPSAAATASGIEKPTGASVGAARSKVEPAASACSSALSAASSPSRRKQPGSARSTIADGEARLDSRQRLRDRSRAPGRLRCDARIAPAYAVISAVAGRRSSDQIRNRRSPVLSAIGSARCTARPRGRRSPQARRRLANLLFERQAEALAGAPADGDDLRPGGAHERHRHGAVRDLEVRPHCRSGGGKRRLGALAQDAHRDRRRRAAEAYRLDPQPVAARRQALADQEVPVAGPVVRGGDRLAELGHQAWRARRCARTRRARPATRRRPRA